MGGSARSVDHVARCWAPHRRRFVYFAERDGRLKIGTSNNVPARMRALGADLLAITPGGFDVEGQMHRRFADFSLGHEWFVDAPSIRALIADLSVPLIPLSPAPPPPGPVCRIWTLAEAAELLDVPLSRVRAQVRATGEIVPGLRAIQIGARFHLSEVMYDRFIAGGVADELPESVAS